MTVYLYILAIPFIFILASKLTLPYSANMLQWLSKLSYNKFFQVCLLIACLILGCLTAVVLSFFADLVTSLNLVRVVLNTAIGLLLGLVFAGSILAIMRYSYEYIVDNKFED